MRVKPLKNRIKRIKLVDAVSFFCFIVFLKPYYFSTKSFVSEIWDLAIVVAIVLSFLIYAVTRVRAFKISAIENYILIYVAYMLINSFTKGIYYNGNIRALLIQISCAILTSALVEMSPSGTAISMRNAFGVFFVINSIMMILFPKGMFIVQSYYEFDLSMWFLGNRNVACRFIICTIFLYFYCSILNTGKLNLKALVFFAAGVISILYLDSATVIIGLIIAALVFLIPNIENRIKAFNLFTIFLASAAVSYVLIVLQTQTSLLNFVEYLGRNLTFSGRTIIWARALNMLPNHFLFGYGIRNQDYLYSTIGASHCHNYYLQLLLNGGMVGAILISLLFYRMSVLMNNNINAKHIRCGLALLASFCVMGITEALTQMPMFFAFFVLIDYFIRNKTENETAQNKSELEI